jgi:hypothetical protein
MKISHHPFLILAAACALHAPTHAQTAAPVVFDLDFTTGAAALPKTAKVIGGEWRGGWVPTDNGQRIEIDAGREIRNGSLEVTFTRSNWSDDVRAYTLPEWFYNAKVINLFEKGDLSGESIQFQVYSRQRIENNQAIVSGGGWQQKIGKWSDYVCDGRTPMTVRLEWKDGRVACTDVKGQTASGGKQPTKLRYVALGGERRRPGSALGMRFLAARLIDLDQGAAPAARDWSKAKITPQKEVPLAAETVPAGARTRVVFDLDLTKGVSVLPKSAWVRGGQWEGGWRVTANRERIVLDPGYPIKNGALEVAFTRKDVPATAEKIDVVSVHETPNIDHTDLHGDAFVLRIGASETNMGLQAGIKTFSKERIPVHFGEGWGQRFGQHEDWVLDDKTPHRFRFEWRNGRMFFNDSKGRTFRCEKDCDNYLDRLRFVALGGDRYDGGPSLVGARFLRVKLEDFDAPEKR